MSDRPVLGVTPKNSLQILGFELQRNTYGESFLRISFQDELFRDLYLPPPTEFQSSPVGELRKLEGPLGMIFTLYISYIEIAGIHLPTLMVCSDNTNREVWWEIAKKLEFEDKWGCLVRDSIHGLQPTAIDSIRRALEAKMTLPPSREAVQYDLSRFVVAS